MPKYPELLELQIQCYSEIGLNWKEIARKMIFNKIDGLYPLMEKAWINAREISSPTYNRFLRFWKREIDVLIVIYVGIGCGAGWATEYKKKPTVLLGLENIAELKWHTKDKLEGLILHELCHIIHVILRGISFKEFETLEEDPLFLLYSEGFAQRCEHLILNKELWRYAQDEKWLEWCIQNENLLAKEFLRKVKNGESG